MPMHKPLFVYFYLGFGFFIFEEEVKYLCVVFHVG